MWRRAACCPRLINPRCAGMAAPALRPQPPGPACVAGVRQDDVRPMALRSTTVTGAALVPLVWGDAGGTGS
jgi:hypothetical protein